PDGKKLAVVPTGGTLKVFDPETGELLKDLQIGCTTMEWLNDDLLACAAYTKVDLVEASTGKVVRSVAAGSTAAPSWVPGRALSGEVHGSEVRFYDVPSGKLTHTFEAHPGGVAVSTWTRDGKFLATSSGAEIKLWDGNTGALLQTLTGHKAAVQALAFA